MEEKKTPVEETVNEAPAAEPAETPAAEPAEAKKPEAGEEKKHRESKREIAALREKVSELEKAVSEEKEKYLRMLAEYDNFRKRSQREREGIYTDAVSDVVGQILPIADNLERAGKYTDGEKVAEGLRLTMNALNECLSKLGVTAPPATSSTPTSTTRSCTRRTKARAKARSSRSSSPGTNAATRSSATRWSKWQTENGKSNL